MRGIFFIVFICGLVVSLSAKADAEQPSKDIFFSEALFYAYQNEYFKAIVKLNTELGQYYLQDEPELDPFHYQIGQAEFSIGDLELSYRMHQRAGHAIKAVLEGNVSEPVRNRAAYRLAKIYYNKNQYLNALHVLQKMTDDVPADIVVNEKLLRAQVYISTGKFSEAIKLLKEIEDEPEAKGFASYNLAIALIQNNEEKEGLAQLDKLGRSYSDDSVVQALQDKANLTLGYRLLEAGAPLEAKKYLQRVRLQGPFSNRALLGLGWVSVSLGRFDRALVPWKILHQRNETNELVQESMLAVPYAYSKLGLHGKAAIAYGQAMDVFGREIETLDSSIRSIRQGKFLKALVSKEVQKNKDLLVNLRDLQDAPETRYILQLMASNDFQESLKNYSDLAELRIELNRWLNNLSVYEELIQLRRLYYEPLLPKIEKQFKKLDSRIKLRLQQRRRLDKRLKSMLISRRPEYLATVDERLALEQIERLEVYLLSHPQQKTAEVEGRIRRIKGVILWNLNSEYDPRLTQAYEHLHELDEGIEKLQKTYASFVRTRQAATQSYQGYDLSIRKLRTKLQEDKRRVAALMARQGRFMESMAIAELDRRRKRLEEYQVKARFALAESYDRASKQQQPQPQAESTTTEDQK